MEKVAFGGGCFWCTEAVFLELKGVKSVIPGYAGGTTEDPTYESVSAGNTGHAEVILIEYSPTELPFEKLVDVFFTSHNPTEVNRQGNDIGTQYRSILLYSTEEQKKIAEDAIKKLEASGKYDKKVATEIVPLTNFYPAEEYHKKYYESHKEEAYSRGIIAPKIDKVRKEHPELIKNNGK